MDETTNYIIYRGKLWELREPLPFPQAWWVVKNLGYHSDDEVYKFSHVWFAKQKYGCVYDRNIEQRLELFRSATWDIV
jgi:hypothetical protein